MTRRHLLYGLLGVGGLCLIVVVVIYLRTSDDTSRKVIVSPREGNDQRGTGEQHAGKHWGERILSSIQGHTDDSETSPSETSPEVMADKWARVEALYNSLTEADWEGLDPSQPHPKKVEILTEGMDAFTAVKYLDSEGGYSDYLLEYAERAVAENPGDFDVLLFYARKLTYNREEEAEAVYRQLLAMAPNSIEVLHELGRVLMYRKPAEAVVHIKKVIAMEPSSFEAHMNLGWSYRQLGRLDEALATFQEAYKILPGNGTMNGINLIKQDMEWYRTNNMQWQTAQEEPAPAETSPEVPPQDLAPPIPDMPDRLEGAAAFDEEPADFTPPSENGDISAAEQQAIEEILKMMEAYEQTLPSESSPSDTVSGRIADLERSIESSPDRRENYLELAEAYEEAGEYEKTAEIYRRARERFPDDERVRRKSEAYREPPEREDEGKYEEDDSYSDDDND